MKVPFGSVSWLRLDSYETEEESNTIITAYLLEVYELNGKPSLSSSYLTITDDYNNDLDVLMDEGNWEIGEIFYRSRTSNEENILGIKVLKESCVESDFPASETVLYIIHLVDRGVIATAAIKAYVFQKSNFVQTFVASTEIHRQIVAANESLTSKVPAEKLKVAYWKDFK